MLDSMEITEVFWHNNILQSIICTLGPCPTKIVQKCHNITLTKNMSTKCQHCWNDVSVTLITFSVGNQCIKRFIGQSCVHTYTTVDNKQVVSQCDATLTVKNRHVSIPPFFGLVILISNLDEFGLNNYAYFYHAYVLIVQFPNAWKR